MIFHGNVPYDDYNDKTYHGRPLFSGKLVDADSHRRAHERRNGIDVFREYIRSVAGNNVAQKSAADARNAADGYDEKQIRKYATPRTDNSKVSAAKLNIAKSMNNSGYSLSEIADRLGVSTSTVSSMLNGQRR